MKRQRLNWLYHLLNGSPCTDQTHAIRNRCTIKQRHTGDKPWITDGYRLLIRKRQRAHVRGDIVEARSLRNKVNRATAKLKFEFYQTRIKAMHKSGTQNWWENMKKINGSKNIRQIKRTEPCE